MAATMLGMSMGGKAQPNDLDKRRVERALKTRRRYRYVEPAVQPVPGGYRIESACCSRNIDPDGGIVDIALLLFDEEQGQWDLFRKDHGKGLWAWDCRHARLSAVLDVLTFDEHRKFWQ
ncbi:hypothetical protein [Xanthobacter tagetidis]|jgi:hypothetical protein|uniref:DUF3024 domain-containing protein n=1 Tax=Xanthobacter tagetidis TaxID=60216 RepID=A0A3L7AMI0_9HYPH|nr:hypothetical protein [Xanthobacter tagetidis]MBB6308083.1 hypothetical protein [Xanthobacter tagetidis]RLP81713.1 hypothetical protein D9R14_01575 [Xanthobacter tagetidis]